MSFFTVVIPLYNKEKYISSTLDSVMAQTFTDFEVILIDDASTDSSLKIAEKYLTDSVSIVKHQQNKGLSAARNTGIRNANSKFIAFIDSDDLWKPNFLEQMHKLIHRFPEAGIFGAAYEEIYEGIALEVDKNVNSKKGKMTLISDFFSANAYQPIFCYSSVVVNKEVFEDVGFFDEKITLGEDVDFNIRAGQKHKVAYFNEVCAGYVIFSENQITNSPISDKVTTDFNKYELAAADNPSLKLYLDVNRYFLAMRYKMSGELDKSKDLVSQINLENLTQRQILLLKSPIWAVNIVRKIKNNLLQKGIRLTTFRA